MKIESWVEKYLFNLLFIYFILKNDTIHFYEIVGQAIFLDWDPFGTSLLMLLPYAHGELHD